MATETMAVLLKDALNPNLVQTLGWSAALVHGGPFAKCRTGLLAGRVCRRMHVIAGQGGLAGSLL